MSDTESESQTDSVTIPDLPKKRHVTDRLCLTIVFACLGGMVCCAYLSAHFGGDPYKFIFGYDSWGNVCNRHNDPIPNAAFSGQNLTGLTRTLHLNWWTWIEPDVPSARLCVSVCPPEDINTTRDLQEYTRRTGNRLCRYDIDVDDYSSDSQAQFCPGLPLLGHVSVFYQCIPRLFVELNSSYEVDNHCHVVYDPQRTWREIGYLCCVTAIMAAGVILLMKAMAAFIIWTLLVATAMGTIAGTAYCWYKWHNLKTSTPTDERSDDDVMSLRQWHVVAGVATAFTVIILLVLIVMRKRIALMVQLFREASKAIHKMPSLLLLPVLTVVIMGVGLAGILWVSLYVKTVGTPVVDPDTDLVTYEKHERCPTPLLHYCNGFAGVWYILFVIACHQMVITGAVTSWYFTLDKKTLRYPVTDAVGRVVRYHVGTAALGALMFVPCQIFNVIVTLITSRLPSKPMGTVCFLLKCSDCCQKCIDTAIYCVSRNAYVMVGLYNCGLLTGAKRAFRLLVQNALQLSAISSVGAFVLLLTKVGLVCIVIIVGIDVFEGMCTKEYTLVILGACAWLVAYIVVSVYGVTIDTIFICFCEDCHRNDGINRPYFMSRGLMEYVKNTIDVKKRSTL